MLFPDPFSALLFDMDGTIVNSAAVVDLVWGGWARSKGLDPVTFLPRVHGRRIGDTIRDAARDFGLGDIDLAAEEEAVTAAEMDATGGVVPVAGAVAFLSALPRDRWAVVTSAPAAMARRRLGFAGIPEPGLLVAAEDVAQGKPAPDCYLLAAQRLGVAPEACLVCEDVQAGIIAGETAGARILVITEMHHAPLATTHVSVTDYRGLMPVIRPDGRIAVERA